MREARYNRMEDEEGKAGVSWNSSTEIIPSNTRGFIAYLSFLLVSLSTNVLLLLHHPPKTCSQDLGKTIYSKITFDTAIPYHSFSEYWSPTINHSQLDEAWDAIDTNPMAVTLHHDYAKHVGLAPSTPFPWDDDRDIYYLKGYHDLHCLKLIRKAIVLGQNGFNLTFTLDHVFHCLDGLRQDIICVADDTPMPVAMDHPVGDGQIRQCRSWEKMKAWAKRPDNDACHRFNDYRVATNTLEWFAFCPHNSPYRATMTKYFEVHGHKDPYEEKSGELL